ncbi:ATP-dependent 6-phosphofructokinase [bacterium]|nr:ATP-dependent 6-phosphofructokinase [bacterium]
MPVKTIGLLTSGGDAPGMNACIATIAARAEKLGLEVRGIFRGLQGLVNADTIPIGVELEGLARRGGSFLGTSRNGRLESKLIDMGIEEAMKHCGVDGLIVLGGGGTLEALGKLAIGGAPIIGVPCTIDNDIFGTDYALGFDSAVNKALRAADEIMDTAESLSERVFMIETLGGRAGHMALETAYSAGADAVFVHEVEPGIDAAINKIKTKMDAGGTHGLVVLCENLGLESIARQLEEGTGRRIRITVLGHTLRGGNPTYFDRNLARQFGETAFDLLVSGETEKMVACVGKDIVSVPLEHIAGKKRDLDMHKYDFVNQR